jgi:hypothetical protein
MNFSESEPRAFPKDEAMPSSFPNGGKEARDFPHAALNEVHHFFRRPPPGRRPVPLRWQRRLRHQHFTMLHKMRLAA